MRARPAIGLFCAACAAAPSPKVPQAQPTRTPAVSVQAPLEELEARLLEAGVDTAGRHELSEESHEPGRRARESRARASLEYADAGAGTPITRTRDGAAATGSAHQCAEALHAGGAQGDGEHHRDLEQRLAVLLEGAVHGYA